MPLDLSDTLVVGISTTALYDLSECDSLFKRVLAKEGKEAAITKYREHMLNYEEQALNAGTGLPIVKALLSLNEYQKKGENPLIQIIIMSRNSPETGVRVLNNIRRQELDISRSAFTGGEPVTDFLEAFDVDLFLTTSLQDAQKVANEESCAVALVKDPPKHELTEHEQQVRIAFDGDAVLFHEESEVVYKTKGMGVFHSIEDKKQDEPMKEGPYANLLRKLARLQERLPHQIEYSPIRIAIVTARNSPAEMRVIKTLRNWKVYVDEIFFLGGVDKTKVLKALKPHIFFDDQDVHLTEASKHIPAGKVPYKSSSPLNNDERKPKKVSPEGNNTDVFNRIRKLFSGNRK